MKQESDGKPFVIIVGKLKGKTDSTTQSFRYPKDQWSSRTAKRHAEAHKAKGFEAAKQTAASMAPFAVTLAGEPAHRIARPSKNDEGVATQKFRKDAVKVGTYWHPKAGWIEEFSADRMDRWCAAFGKMKANGVPVEFFADHDPTTTKRSDDIRGYVDDMWRDGNELMVVVEAVGEDGIKLCETCRNVSAEIEREFKDSKRNEYGEVIAALVACEKPIITGQRPFERIAASHHNGEQKIAVLVELPDGGEIPNEDGDMDKQLLSLIGKLGDTDDVTEDNALTVLGEVAEASKTKDEEIVTLKADLTAEQAKKASGKMPEVDEDVLEDIGETRTTELSLLVAEGKITPAVAKKLSTILIGASGKRLTFGLSTKAAKAFGLDAPLAKQVIEALKLNDPVKLGEKTRSQTLSLVCPDPDENEPSVDPGLNARADAAYGGKTGTDDK